MSSRNIIETVKKLRAKGVEFLPTPQTYYDTLIERVGDFDEDYYIPQKSEWHRINRGEIYTHNPKLSYMKVPDRGLWMLQQFGIKVTDKEYIGIKLTDGLYDEANKSYYISYNPDWKLKSNLSYVLHQADMMATHIEYDKWKYRGKEETKQPTKRQSLKKKEPSKNMDAFKELFGEKK